MSAVPVIAIDGPSGSGKGTIARRVAAALGFHLLDSGALYRLTALAAGRRGVDADDVAGVVRAARDRMAFGRIGHQTCMISACLCSSVSSTCLM